MNVRFFLREWILKQKQETRE